MPDAEHPERLDHEELSQLSVGASDPDPSNAVRRDRLRAALFDQTPPPRRVGRFPIHGVLGRGGMGVVLDAVDPVLDRPVALKLLHPRLDQTHQQRLMDEARLLAKVTHPNVVHVYEVGEVDGRVFIAMERVQGQTLRQWQQGRPPWKRCLEAYLQAGRGLAAAHAVGVVHRDFKPHNCMREDGGRVLVLDFGLAQDTAEPATGSSGGTRAYMAPEQRAGSIADARSDQYGFCVALREAVGGAAPRWLQRALARGLRDDPDERWPDMQSLLHALRPRDPRLRVAGGLLLVAGVAAGIPWLVRPSAVVVEPCTGAQAKIDEVWNDERRAEVATGIEATGLPIAPEVWERTRGRLDAYAGRWSQAHTEVCRATHVLGEQSSDLLDLRMACLESRREGLSSLLSALSRADDSAVLAAIDAAMALPSVEDCRTVALGEDPEPPEAAPLRRALLDAKASQELGDVEGAHAALTDIEARAREQGLARVAVAAKVSRGEVEYAQGRGQDADLTLETALWDAVRVGDDAMALEAAILHVNVVGLLLGQAERSLTELGHAEALLERLGSPEPARLSLSSAAGEVLGRHGRVDEGRARLEQAEALARALHGTEHPAYSRVLSARGLLELSSDRPQQARELLERTLAIDRQLYGLRHPIVAQDLNNLATIDAGQQRWSDARQRLRLAIEIQRAALGSGPMVADNLINLAAIELFDGDKQAALELATEAYEINAEHLGQDAARTLDAQHVRGMVLVALGRPEQGEPLLQQVVELQKQTLGPRHPDLRRSLMSWGRALMKLDRADEAVEPLRLALELDRERVEASGGDPGESSSVREYSDALEEALERAAQ
ncbi:MAG: serine/threonine-protein kinase [Nannocystaceae bacterium]